jgi:deoxyhypusine synthase
VKYKPVDLGKVKLQSIKQRKHKVRIADFGKVSKRKNPNLAEYLDSLPNILAAKDFCEIVQAIVTAERKKKPVIVMLGGHTVKCGVSPFIIELMNRGVITAVAMNGATSIHDFEIAYYGETSEQVDETLDRGTFGMVKETGELMHQAITEGLVAGVGLGRALGNKLLEIKAKNKVFSILATAAKLDIPVTVHVAIGTDTIHQHPNVDGAALGESSLLDFRLLTDVVKDLGNGGVVLNIGSAVILPEVFLKVLTIARNLGYPVRNFVTANFDMEQHYRPQVNVVQRPTHLGGKGYSITGHHELMIPLLVNAVLIQIQKNNL